MEVNMSVEEVVNQISELVEKEGKPPLKKEVKKSNPELMKNALYYFPSWDDAVEHGDFLLVKVRSPERIE